MADSRFSEQKKARVGILGASGYTGVDLIRLLARHPLVEIVLMTGERHAGKAASDVFPNLLGLDLPDLISVKDVEWPALDLDAVFCGLPHATSQEVIKGLCHAVDHSLLQEVVAEGLADLAKEASSGIKIIDLSADFRLRDVETYAEWYGRPHAAVDLQPKAVYGLTEWYREAIKTADLVACPGCYPTAALLTLVPLLKAGLIEIEDILIDAKSGVSGAGRSLKESNLFTEVSEAMHPYGVGHHRHMPEIEQELSAACGEDVRISFTPHLVPMNRGELLTSYVRAKEGVELADLRTAWQAAYEDEAFIHILPEGVVAATRMVRGSNLCVLGAFQDRIPGRFILSTAIDNLVKGSSGQAVQNMNLMLGMPETLGLQQVGLFP